MTRNRPRPVVRSRRSPLALGILVACAAVLGTHSGCTGCTDERNAPAYPPGSPEATAVALFDVADDHLGPPADEDAIARVLAPDEDGDTAAMLDALATLRGMSRVRVVGVAEITVGSRWALDLEAEVPGGGLAEFAVDVIAGEDGAPRVRWFAGPHDVWPRPRSSDPDGVRSSPTPYDEAGS